MNKEYNKRNESEENKMTKKSNIIKKTKRIYTKSVALELRKRGFKIIRTEPNENYPQFDTYIFQGGAALEKALTEITNSRSNYLKIK